MTQGQQPPIERLLGNSNIDPSILAERTAVLLAAEQQMDRAIAAQHVERAARLVDDEALFRSGLDAATKDMDRRREQFEFNEDTREVDAKPPRTVDVDNLVQAAMTAVPKPKEKSVPQFVSQPTTDGLDVAELQAQANNLAQSSAEIPVSDVSDGYTLAA